MSGIFFFSRLLSGLAWRRCGFLSDKLIPVVDTCISVWVTPDIRTLSGDKNLNRELNTHIMPLVQGLGSLMSIICFHLSYGPYQVSCMLWWNFPNLMFRIKHFSAVIFNWFDLSIAPCCLPDIIVIFTWPEYWATNKTLIPVINNDLVFACRISSNSKRILSSMLRTSMRP